MNVFLLSDWSSNQGLQSAYVPLRNTVHCGLPLSEF